MSQSDKLWGGRFDRATSSLMETFSESISIDHRLYEHDIRASIAHARMLAQTGIIAQSDFDSIEQGLLKIRASIEDGSFQWSEELEDVHMNIESALTRDVGEAGKRLHTARSRNDQVATDMRLYLRDELDAICSDLSKLQQALVALALAEADTIMPGFTHMQSAQPVTFGHHVLAWNAMLERDYQRLQECRSRVNISPLGCAALAGTSFPVDRGMTAAELGFEGISANSLDAVSDRDFVIEFTASASLLMVHLSRMAEELVLWSSPAFGFVDLGDEFCTGSSIMPQKRNPDMAELLRGKSGRVSGSLMAMLMLVKGQPLAYNRDNQEDKGPMFDSADTVSLSLRVFAAMVPGLTIHRDRMRAAASEGFSTATDLADYLVRKQIPFRDAHEIVGRIVGYAEKQGLSLEDIPLAKLQEFCPDIVADVHEILGVEGSVRSRNHIGGTAPEQVRLQADLARQLLDARSAKQG